MGFYDEEDPTIWKKWWVGMWAVIIVALLTTVFFIGFRAWAIAATFASGVPEAVGLIHHHDPYPPLTYVTRYYLPRWLAITAIYGLLGACGAFWLGFSHQWRVGALFGLLGWLSNHFTVTYDDPGTTPTNVLGKAIRRKLSRST